MGIVYIIQVFLLAFVTFGYLMDFIDNGYLVIFPLLLLKECISILFYLKNKICTEKKVFKKKVSFDVPDDDEDGIFTRTRTRKRINTF